MPPDIFFGSQYTYTTTMPLPAKRKRNARSNARASNARASNASASNANATKKAKAAKASRDLLEAWLHMTKNTPEKRGDYSTMSALMIALSRSKDPSVQAMFRNVAMFDLHSVRARGRAPSHMRADGTEINAALTRIGAKMRFADALRQASAIRTKYLAAVTKMLTTAARLHTRGNFPSRFLSKLLFDGLPKDKSAGPPGWQRWQNSLSIPPIVDYVGLPGTVVFPHLLKRNVHEFGKHDFNSDAFSVSVPEHPAHKSSLDVFHATVVMKIFVPTDVRVEIRQNRYVPDSPSIRITVTSTVSVSKSAPSRPTTRTDVQVQLPGRWPADPGPTPRTPRVKEALADAFAIASRFPRRVSDSILANGGEIFTEDGDEDGDSYSEVYANLVKAFGAQATRAARSRNAKNTGR